LAIDCEALYRRYGPTVLRRCRRLLCDEEKAADAMHDVFVELLRRKDRLAETAPAALVQRVATNVCLNRLRGQARRPEDGEGDDLLLRIAATGSDLELRTLARAALRRIFGEERVSTQTIAVMHLVDGMTLDEVAADVGMSVSGVRKRLRTLKARVAELEGV